MYRLYQEVHEKSQLNIKIYYFMVLDITGKYYNMNLVFAICIHLHIGYLQYLIFFVNYRIVIIN